MLLQEARKNVLFTCVRICVWDGGHIRGTENLESLGWFNHFVVSETDGERWVNYHTHGLPEHYGHLDF